MKELGLYIHIPFCKKKCLYCDFTSYEGAKDLERPYMDALFLELERYLKENKTVFRTVFIGGGTPTFVEYENIVRLMERIVPYVNKDGEITIECNPGTITREAVKAYKRMGINRVSVGLQAWQDELLKVLGRIHNQRDFLNTYYILRDGGFENISVDLMFALPGQTLDMWEETMVNICKLQPEHISTYALILEESTPICSMIKSGELAIPDEDQDREMYHLAKDIFKGYGYNQYEISNFAREGFECLHNLIYWRNEEYLGLGAGSHSKIGGKRFWKEKNLERYIELIDKGKSPVIGSEIIDFNEDIYETIILALRLNEGINFPKFNKRYGINFMDIYGKEVYELENLGLIKVDGESLCLTDKGMDLCNMVSLKFIK